MAPFSALHALFWLCLELFGVCFYTTDIYTVSDEDISIFGCAYCHCQVRKLLSKHSSVDGLDPFGLVYSSCVEVVVLLDLSEVRFRCGVEYDWRSWH
jgi:hypothetical protein